MQGNHLYMYDNQPLMEAMQVAFCLSHLHGTTLVLPRNRGIRQFYDTFTTGMEYVASQDGRAPGTFTDVPWQGRGNRLGT